MLSYGEDLISKANAGHGCCRSLGNEADKDALVNGKEADTTLSLGILAQRYLTYT